MDVVRKVFGFFRAGDDREHRNLQARGEGREEIGTGRLWDGYGRASAHERLHALVRQQVEKRR
jgi:hypothetical protein